MPHSSTEREKKILELLQEQGSVSVQELADAFQVSNMTIHRDLNKLHEMGHIRKKHGGATLTQDAHILNSASCRMCTKPISTRTEFIVQLETGEQVHACCAHCGLMIQTKAKNVWQSLVVDYLYGHMVSAKDAVYLMESDVKICCVPSILSFGSREEAEKFKKGFGGKLMTMEQAVRHLHG